jgi:hypothetical protein
MYSRLVRDALYYGMPAARRGGVFIAAAARTGWPERLATAVALGAPRSDRADLDELKVLAIDFGISAHSLLLLERSSATTVFAFDRDGHPAGVLKRPRGGTAGVEREVAALQAVASSGLAPAYLGERLGWYAQEMIAAQPRMPTPISVAGAAGARWTAADDEAAAGITALATKSVSCGRPAELNDGVVERLFETGAIPDHLASVVGDALAEAARVDRRVVKHGDTSPQNCLYRESRLAGFVDWENARLDGAPGFDAWNACVALVEHGLALRRWNPEVAAAGFARAWHNSELVRMWRAAAASSCQASGVAGRDVITALEILFFARRAAQRIGTTSGAVSLRHLGVVCGL